MNGQNIVVADRQDGKDRAEHDFYSTEPTAIDHLLEFEDFNSTIWENACGNGALVNRLKKLGYDVVGTDLIDRSQGEYETVNFLENPYWFENKYSEKPVIILTNPPFKDVIEWVITSLDVLSDNGKLYLFLKIQFLETKSRYKFFTDNMNLEYVYCFSHRIKTYDNGVIDEDASSLVFYAWYVWNKQYTGYPTIKWLNPDFDFQQKSLEDFW